MADNSKDAVAVVDDDVAVRDSLKFLLETAGHTVTTYSSAAAFLDHRGPRPACLVVDYHMPRMTGLELAAQLQQEGANIPLLLITGSVSPAIVANAARLGIGTVLEKPLNANDLLKFVDTHF
ncbi:MAG: response regulator [Rhodopila sp.]|nr:response regulator [Rhodopila sp.]